MLLRKKFKLDKVCLFWSAVVLGTTTPVVLAQTSPVVAGFERLSDAENPSVDRLGELLLGELNCLSCHTAIDAVQARIWTKQAPDLSEAGKRLTPQYLRAFLSNPHEIKPGTTMPNVLHASEERSKNGAIDFLVHFLVSRGGPISIPKTGGNADLVDMGQKLFHQVGCVACHGPQDGEDSSLPQVPLGSLALKTTVDELIQFLLDPHEMRPSGRMPNLSLSDGEARALAIYLLREQLDNPLSQSAPEPRMPGLNYEYFELEGLNRLPDFTMLKPKAVGSVDQITLNIPSGKRDNNYAIRYSGLLKISQTGTYTFRTESDDGSRLWIDGKLIVDNDGVHGARRQTGDAELTAGDHSIEIGFFNQGGEERLGISWSGPEIRGRRRPIPATALWRSGGNPMVPLQHAPFALDPAKVQMGAQMFSALRCVSCHAFGEMKPMRPARALVDLRLDSANGCLSQNIRKGLPNYYLSKEQRSALVTVLQKRASLSKELTPPETVGRTLAAFNCYACHKRDGFGGPDETLANNYFQVLNDIDLGEEGKIPPRLTGMGTKFKKSALESILDSSELHIRRRYMATRMPRFGLANLQPFIENIGQVDHFSETDALPAFTAESARVGQKLVGMKGLSCIACHRILGQKAAGIQGIDLLATYDRLTPQWFRRYLLDPGIFKPGTRMPVFWPDGDSLFPDILGGDTSKQIGAIWSYLSLKKSMPWPEGIVPEGNMDMELIPSGVPIVHRTFMNGVGPRTILTGFPEKISVAFDANQVRLAKVWRGRFFDQSGVASARTDKFLDPLGDDILDLPAGPAFAQLITENDAWPIAEKTSRDIGGDFLGYELNANHQPILKYRIAGVLVEELARPIIQPGGAILSRSFKLHPGNDSERLYFLAAAGDSIEKIAEGTYRVDDKLDIFLKIPKGNELLLRQQTGHSELLVSIALDGKPVELGQIIRW